MLFLAAHLVHKCHVPLHALPPCCTHAHAAPQCTHALLHSVWRPGGDAPTNRERLDLICNRLCRPPQRAPPPRPVWGWGPPGAGAGEPPHVETEVLSPAACLLFAPAAVVFVGVHAVAEATLNSWCRPELFLPCSISRAHPPPSLLLLPLSQWTSRAPCCRWRCGWAKRSTQWRRSVIFGTAVLLAEQGALRRAYGQCCEPVCENVAAPGMGRLHTGARKHLSLT